MSVNTLVAKFKKSRPAWVILAGIALIPLIYAGTLTWANQDPTHHLEGVPAAVVNEDVSTTVGAEHLDLGSSLTHELTTSTSASNFHWTSMDASAAADALESGNVFAILTIPADFSANVASSADADPLDAAVAQVSMRTNDGANLIAGSIAKAIGTQIRASLAEQVSAEYLSQVYVGFTTVHDHIADAATGAGDLADGASAAASGSADLVVGLDQLAAGSADLSNGIATLANGTASAQTGAATLASGLATLDAQAAALPDQTSALNAGAQQVATGAASTDSAAGQLADASSTVSTGLDKALAGAIALVNGSTSLANATPDLSVGAAAVSTGLDDLLARYGTLSDDERLKAITALAAGADTVTQGAADADTAAHTLAGGATQLVGAETTHTGLAALSPGSHALDDGLHSLASQTPALRSGAAGVAAATGTLATKAPELTDGIDAAASGAQTLAAGATRLNAGAQAVSTGAGSLVAGTASAASGADTLHAGLDEMADGAGSLATGLDSGLADIPSYTDAEAHHLSDVEGAPITLATSRVNEVPGYGYGLAPYFTALALWVGALAYYLMMPALTRRALDRRGSPVRVAARSYLPGALVGIVQSVLATIILIAAVGIHPANGWGLFGMMALTSITFIAINQALIALLGAPGRFVALILIVLQLAAAGGTYPIETAPAFFQAIHPWLPLTYSVEAFRALIAGGSIGIAPGVGVLFAWLAGAFGVTVLAAWRARRTASAEAVVAAEAIAA